MGNFRIILAAILSIILFACKKNEVNIVKLEGYAQGTTYHIAYVDKQKRSFKRQIDSLLIVIDNSLSTYQKNSFVSLINNENDSLYIVKDELFKEVFLASKKVYEASGGLFDPTVAQLINAWGFGFENYKTEADTAFIDSLTKMVGFNKFELRNDTLFVPKNLKLDFNAIAQGFSVDFVGKFLEANGIENYMVEIGGELKAKGRKSKTDKWRIGIDKPIDTLKHRELQFVIELEDEAMATSGNYRKYYVKNGVKYSHTINPKTGYPVTHNLLSATVITKECVYADAYATAFMVMGLEKSKAFLSKHPEIKAMLVYDDNGVLSTYFTEGLKERVKEVN